jgi:hypothetical protein
VEHLKRSVDNRSRLERRLWARTWHSKTHSSRCWGAVTYGVENRNRDLYDFVSRKAEVRTYVSGLKNARRRPVKLNEGYCSSRVEKAAARAPTSRTGGIHHPEAADHHSRRGFHATVTQS